MRNVIPNNSQSIIYYFEVDGQIYEFDNHAYCISEWSKSIDVDKKPTDIKCKVKNKILKIS